MKKKLFSLVLAICLVLPCVILMTACSKKAYSVSGKTFELNANDVIIVWKDGVTDAEKKAFLEDEFKDHFEDGVTEEKVIEMMKKRYEDGIMTVTFNKDGSVVMKQSYKDGDETKTEESTYYYSQSKDKKEIKIYDKKDYTSETEPDMYFLFREGSLYVVNGEYGADATANLLIGFKKK